MILKRLRFINKLFSGGGANPEDKFPGCAELGLRDIIKLISMGHSCPGNVSHWLNEVGDGINLTIKNTNNGSASLMFLGFGDKEEILRLGKPGMYYRKLKPIPVSSWDYFCKLWKEIYDDRDSKGYKYRHLISQSPSSEVYETIYRVIAYITGTISINDDIGVWSITPEYPPINFSSSIFDGPINSRKDNITTVMRKILSTLIGLQ